MVTLKTLAVAALLLAAGVVPSHAAGRLGVILLHDHAGAPAQLTKLSAALTADGYAVAAPELCWSDKRLFDAAFADCLKDVDAAAMKLKAGGATKIVVGGFGGGAIAAIDYGVLHKDLAGIIALAPTADPPDPEKFPAFAASLKSAAALLKSGKTAKTPAAFSDVIAGADFPVTTTPAIFLSFHGTTSPISTIRLVKSKVLPKLTLPLLWLSGSKDATQASTRATFGAAPDNKLSDYEIITADHAGTPDAAAEAIDTWLKTLP